MPRRSMKGPHSLEEWIEIYEERDDSKFILSPGEDLRWSTELGFFTWWYDAARHELVIPKMCGDGKHWREVIRDMARAMGPMCARVSACTKRDPRVYLRAVGGGKVRKVEYAYDFETGEGKTIWHVAITWEDNNGK